MAQPTLSLNPLACEALPGAKISYATNPNQIGNFGLPDYIVKQMADPQNTQGSHVRGNVYEGVVIGSGSSNNNLTIGEIDPLTGTVVQGVYYVRPAYANFMTGTLQVNKSNVVCTQPSPAPRARVGPGGPFRPRGLYDNLTTF